MDKISPLTTVNKAAQRNQNNAVGAITFPMAGFCSSGIFGMEGICTKLKYQSKPIHMMPTMTWIQRNRKGNSIELKLAPKAKIIKTRSTNPANTVRPNEVKMDDIRYLLCIRIRSNYKRLWCFGLKI